MSHDTPHTAGMLEGVLAVNPRIIDCGMFDLDHGGRSFQNTHEYNTRRAEALLADPLKPDPHHVRTACH